MTEKRSDWWMAIAGLVMAALLAAGFWLLFRGQGQTPVATATQGATPMPPPTAAPTETALPTGAPSSRYLSRAVEVAVPQEFRLMDLHGDTVVGSLRIGDEPQIMLLDLTTGAMKQVSSAVGTDGKNSARISDQWVAWIEWTRTATGPWDYRLEAHDREAEREFTVEVDYLIWLDLSDDVVVWQTYGSESNIFAQNLRTGQRWAVAEDPGPQKYPQISGSWIIYLDLAKHSPEEQVADLWAYNLDSGEDQLLGQVYNPLMGSVGIHHAISDNLVIWTAPSGSGDYLYERLQLVSLELDDIKRQPSLVMSGDIAYLHLFDNILVYHKGGGKVLYDLGRRKVLTTIEPSMGVVVAAFVSGDRVVWMENDVNDRNLLYTAGIQH